MNLQKIKKRLGNSTFKILITIQTSINWHDPNPTKPFSETKLNKLVCPYFPDFLHKQLKAKYFCRQIITKSTPPMLMHYRSQARTKKEDWRKELHPAIKTLTFVIG